MISAYVKQIQRVWTARGNRNHRVAAVIRAARWFISKRFIASPRVMTVFGNLQYKAYADAAATSDLKLFGDYYTDTLEFVQQFLRPGDAFVDVGANVGLFTLLASKSTSDLTCFEPGAIQSGRLDENLRLNGIEATMHVLAASDTEAVLRFATADTLSHVINQSDETAQPDVNSETVRACRLDEILPDRVFNLLKLDVEGHELAALRGAVKLIENGRLPVILMEVNGSGSRYGVDDSEPIEFLKSRGYRVGMFDLDKRHFEEAITRCEDVVAVTPEGMIRLRERFEGMTVN